MKYMDTERERFQYKVRQTLNGWAIQVHIVPTNEWVALTPEIARLMDVLLFDAYRYDFPANQEAEAWNMLANVALLNCWEKVLEEGDK